MLLVPVQLYQSSPCWSSATRQTPKNLPSPIIGENCIIPTVCCQRVGERKLASPFWGDKLRFTIDFIGRNRLFGFHGEICSQKNLWENFNEDAILVRRSRIRDTQKFGENLCVYDGADCDYPSILHSPLIVAAPTTRKVFTKVRIRCVALANACRGDRDGTVCDATGRNAAVS